MNNKAKFAEEINNERLLSSIDQLRSEISEVRTGISSVIFGQSQVIEEAMVTILSGGHILLIGVPGLGKTKLVDTIGNVFGLNSRRIQFTPDLMPADILGSEILEESDAGQRVFRFIKGPIFSQLLMADEINRASPRTQSALLQAMEECRVSVAGEYHKLPSPFHVLATQNPLEQEGTYPLPEAQLDRFFMQIDIGYPDIEAERKILINTTGSHQFVPTEIMNYTALSNSQKLIRQIPVSKTIMETILKLVRSGRPETSDISSVVENVSWGPGPRASQALMLGVRARAIIHGRLAPSIDDLILLAPPVLRHRMGLNFSARAEGVKMNEIIIEMCDRVV